MRPSEAWESSRLQSPTLSGAAPWYRMRKSPGNAMDIHPEIAALVGEIDFDPDALHAKYLAERDKRLREDGIAPVRRGEGGVLALRRRPLCRTGFTRAPVFDEVEFAIIGGGFGGLLMGARLREAGFEQHPHGRERRRLRRHLVLEPLSGRHVRRGDRYCYLPLLEELGYMPKHKYSFAPEILEHSRNIARHYRLYRRRPAADRRHRAALGRGRPSAGSSAPTAATASRPSTWPWPTVR